MNKVKEENKIEITKDTNIAELVVKYPQAAEILSAFGLHCIGCFASAFDTLGQGAEIHGIDEEELNEMLEEVNKIINEPENYR